MYREKASNGPVSSVNVSKSMYPNNLSKLGINSPDSGLSSSSESVESSDSSQPNSPIEDLYPPVSYSLQETGRELYSHSSRKQAVIDRSKEVLEDLWLYRLNSAPVTPPNSSAKIMRRLYRKVFSVCSPEFRDRCEELDKIGQQSANDQLYKALYGLFMDKKSFQTFAIAYVFAIEFCYYHCADLAETTTSCRQQTKQPAASRPVALHDRRLQAALATTFNQFFADQLADWLVQHGGWPAFDHFFRKTVRSLDQLFQELVGRGLLVAGLALAGLSVFRYLTS